MHKGSYQADKSEESEVSTTVGDEEHLVADQPIRLVNRAFMYRLACREEML